MHCVVIRNVYITHGKNRQHSRNISVNIHLLVHKDDILITATLNMTTDVLILKLPC